MTSKTAESVVTMTLLHSFESPLLTVSSELPAISKAIKLEREVIKKIVTTIELLKKDKELARKRLLLLQKLATPRTIEGES